MKYKIAIVVPSLVSGGMERVASELANAFSAKKEYTVHLILLSKQEIFYSLSDDVIIHEPGFKGSKSIVLITNILRYLRSKIRTLRPDTLLSFGSMYNSFVMLAVAGLKVNTYLSDRSNPYRNSVFINKENTYNNNDGLLHVCLKWLLYRRATGIIAQTKLSRHIDENFLNHKNIAVIGNPIRPIEEHPIEKENIILNVGRFTKLKNQQLLVDIFAETDAPAWQLHFVGDGPYLQEVKEYVVKKNMEDRIKFFGPTPEIDYHYRKSKIFAFTSYSEGFPNALGEAMNTPLAVISFDCIAGPADLIQDGHNGFLIPVGDTKEYTNKLQLLVQDEILRRRFEENASLRMKEYCASLIADKYLSFITA